MIDISDQDLVSQCLAGNTQVFEILVDRYHRQVFNIIYRMTNNYDVSEEITQSVFVKAYEKLIMYNPKFKFFSWIYKMTVNETINFLNRQNRIGDLNKDVVSSEKRPDEVYEEVELSENLHNALMTIGLEYQSLIVLRHFQNLPYRDIAYIVDIPEKKVKSRLFTARKLLKEVLVKNGITSNEG